MLLDGAHNPHGVAALADTLRSVFPDGGDYFTDRYAGGQGNVALRLLVGSALPPGGMLYAWGPRPSLPAGEMKQQMEAAGCREVLAIEKPEEALEKAWVLADGGPLVVGGSFYLGAAVRSTLLDRAVLRYSGSGLSSCFDRKGIE